MEANLDSLKTRREHLCYKFAIKCTKSEKSKEMFPVRIKDHQMEIRNEEKFLVQHANTERLKNSAIPYMQRLLNKYDDGSLSKNERTRMPG